MPPYQVVDFGPSPAQETASNLGRSFGRSFQQSRERERQQDELEKLFGSQNTDSNRKAPNNIEDIIASVSKNPETLANAGIVAGEIPQSSKINRLTPEKRAQLNVINPQLSKALDPLFKEKETETKEGLKADVARSREYLSKIDQIRDSIGRKELSLRQIDEALASRSNLDFLGDQLADITGLENFRSAKGAQLLSSTKEFFLSDLASIPGVRANQFLEKALSSALTDPNRRQEANQMVAAGMRSNLKLDKVKTELAAQLEDSYRNKQGYIPATISRQVTKMLTPYAQQIQDEWADEVQHITERNNPEIKKFIKVKNDPEKRKIAARNVKLKPVVPGAVLDDTIGMILLEKYNDDDAKALHAAKQLGYKIPGQK